MEDALGTFRVGTTGPGRRPALNARAEIVRLRSEGMSAASVARRFNRAAVPTPSGRGQWWPSTVLRHAEPGPWRDYIARYRARHPR